MDIVAVTVWDEEEVSILDGEKLNPVICGFVESDDEEVTVNELTAKGALILLALSITVMVQLL
jgi:hypothetical protein